MKISSILSEFVILAVLVRAFDVIEEDYASTIKQACDQGVKYVAKTIDNFVSKDSWHSSAIIRLAFNEVKPHLFTHPNLSSQQDVEYLFLSFVKNVYVGAASGLLGHEKFFPDQKLLMQAVKDLVLINTDCATQLVVNIVRSPKFHDQEALEDVFDYICKQQKAYIAAEILNNLHFRPTSNFLMRQIHDCLNQDASSANNVVLSIIDSQKLDKSIDMSDIFEMARQRNSGLIMTKLIKKHTVNSNLVDQYLAFLKEKDLGQLQNLVLSILYETDPVPHRNNIAVIKAAIRSPLLNEVFEINDIELPSEFSNRVAMELIVSNDPKDLDFADSILFSEKYQPNKCANAILKFFLHSNNQKFAYRIFRQLFLSNAIDWHLFYEDEFVSHPRIWPYILRLWDVNKDYDPSSFTEDVPEKIQALFVVEPISEMQQKLIDACIAGKIEEVKQLLNTVDPSKNSSVALRKAFDAEQTEVVKLLLADKRADPTVFQNRLLRIACVRGNVELLNLLLQDDRASAIFANKIAVALAFRHHQIHVAKILLSDSWILFPHEKIPLIRWAFDSGYFEIVSFFFKQILSNPPKDISANLLNQMEKFTHQLSQFSLNYRLPNSRNRNNYEELVDGNWAIKTLSEVEKYYVNFLFDGRIMLFAGRFFFTFEGFKQDITAKYMIQSLKKLSSGSNLGQGLDSIFKDLGREREFVELQEYLQQIQTPVNKSIQAIKQLEIGKSWAYPISSQDKGRGHATMSFITKQQNDLYNLKLFNTGFGVNIFPDNYPESVRKAPFVEFSDVTFEELSEHIFQWYKKIKTYNIPAKYFSVGGLAPHQLKKWQKEGTCAANAIRSFCKWILGLEKYMILKVFIILELLQQKVHELDFNSTPLGHFWTGLTLVPHLEGRLLKEIERIKTYFGDRPSYHELRKAIFISTDKYPESIKEYFTLEKRSDTQQRSIDGLAAGTVDLVKEFLQLAPSENDSKHVT